MSVGVEGAGGPGAGMRQRSSWAALCVLVLALWPEAGKLASGQAQRIALYSGADGKGQAVLLTDSCEDLGDRSKPGCTGIPAGTSFDNKAQSARIDGFWVLYNDKRFGPSDPIHYIVGMDKTVNLGRSSSKASSVRRVGSLTNWKKDEHLSLFQYKNFAGNEVVMNPYQPTFFGHEGIPAQSAVAINSEWTVVTEHQNFCLRAKGGAYVVMDFRKEFDLSLEMILHIRHGCMLATGAKNSSHGGFSVVSPTLSPSGGAQQQQQPQQQPPQQQQQSMSSQQGASQQHQQMQAPLHSRMLQRRRSANHDQYGSPPLQQQQQNMYQQLELDPLNKILPPGVGSGPQLALTLTREVSTLLPAAMQEPPPQPYVDQANAADPHQPMPQQFSLKPSWSPFAAAGSGTALGNRQMSSQSAQQQPASPSALVQQEPSALAPPKQYMDQPQQQRGNLPVDAFAAEPRQMEPQQQQQQKPQGNSMRLPDRHRLTESVSTDEYQPMQKQQQQQQAVPHYQQVSSGSLCGGSALSMDRRTSYAARPRVNSGRPFGRFHHKPRLERPLPAPLPAAAPQQPMPNSAQQTSDEQASGPNLQYGTQAREGYEGPENPAEMEQSKESSQGAPGQPMQEDPTGVSQEQQPLPPPPPMVEDDSQQQQSRVQQPQNYCPSSQPEQQQQQQPEPEQQPPLSASPTLDTKSSNNNNKAPSDTAQGLQQQVMSKSPSAADISVAKHIGPRPSTNTLLSHQQSSSYNNMHSSSSSSNNNGTRFLTPKVRFGSRLGSSRLVQVRFPDRKPASNIEKLRKLKSFYPPALNFISGNRPSNMKQIKPIGPKQPIPISQESGTFARSSGPMGSQLNVSTDTKDIAAVVSSDTTSPTMDPSAAAASMAFTSINSIVTHHQADNNNTTLDNGNAVTIANYTNYDTSSTTVMSSGSASPLVPSRK